MKKRGLVPLVWVLFLAPSLSLLAQTKTNGNILRDASRQTAQNERTLRTLLEKLSNQKGWPLQIRGRQGKLAILHGIDLAGNPLYISVDDNIISAATIGTSLLWPGGSAGLNLDGSSALLNGRIAIWDEARPLATHVELSGRVVQQDNASTVSDHSTHVAGTMIARGINPLAKGMSFNARQLQAYDYNNDNSEMLGAATSLLISNHSYGFTAGWNYNSDLGHWEFYGNPGDTADYKFGNYSSDAQLWDSISYNAPFYLIVKAAGNNRNVNGPAPGTDYWRFNSSNIMVDAGLRPAGLSNNDGYDIISTTGCAKNILTVGAVGPIPGGYSGVSDVSMADFSSWGPTDDGRIKPDVVADGVDVLSSIATSDSAYASLSGTSMSTPAASGSLLLLQEYYARLHSDSLLRSATLKGLVIHTADEAGIADGPDYIYGWGLINMQKAAAVISARNTDQLIAENSLTNTGADTAYTLDVVASGKGPLVATISWTDPPGTPVTTHLLNNPAKMLVNDLDLRITQGSHTWAPYILDRTHPGNAATTGDDTLNNVEKIVIKEVIPGQSYRIRIRHKGALARGSQAYSLLVSGVGGTGYCPSAATNTAGTRIDSVVLGSFTNANPAGCTSYTDYTSLRVSIEPNQKLPLRVVLSSCDATNQQRVVKVFIDYNSDGQFEEGEQVAVSGVLNGGSLVYADTIRIPHTLQAGSYGLLRVIAQETTDTATVKACGLYGNGETQDYTAAFADASNNVGVTQIVDPSGTVCADDSQLVTVRIKNFGSVPQSGVGITTVVSSGGNVVTTLHAVYPATIPAFTDVVYTHQSGFAAAKGNTYSITSYTVLAADQSSSDDTSAAVFTVSAGQGAPSGQAEYCGSDKVYLQAAGGSGQAFWYSAADATTPIAAGFDTSTSVLTADKTYWLGLNDSRLKLGPVNKQVFSGGGYNSFNYNFVNFTNDIPLTIQSARLYIAYPGKITFTVADLDSYDTATGNFTVTDLSSTTIRVYSTYPHPAAGDLEVNDPLDTGAVYYLGLSVPTAGKHIIYINCDSATIFRNGGIRTSPYPYTIPGVLSITGNSAISATDPHLYQQYYYFFYDMALRLADCPSPRVPVVAADSKAAPVISLTGNTFTSTEAAHYQWYVNDLPIGEATGQKDTAYEAGSYSVLATDSLGCSQRSNAITFSPGDGPGVLSQFTIYPNPGPGQFTVSFILSKADNTDLILFNTLGQEVFHQSYPDFAGRFTKSIYPGNLPSGVYYLKVRAGGKNYVKKVTIIK